MSSKKVFIFLFSIVIFGFGIVIGYNVCTDESIDHKPIDDSFKYNPDDIMELEVIIFEEYYNSKGEWCTKEEWEEEQLSINQLETQESYSYSYTPYTNDFQTMGVVYDDSHRYSWYSSNVLYHYKTAEWTPGDDGIYRDTDGYIVVASCDYDYGTVIDETPFGPAKVYDYCYVPGTLDVYVNF